MSEKWIDSRNESPGDPWNCKDGRVHQWTYLGNVRAASHTSTYRCLLCGIFITKGTLKEMTDGGPK